MRRGVVVITTAQLYSTKPELTFCAGSNPARGVSEIRDGEDLWQWSRLEIKLNAFRRSTILQKQFIITNHIHSISNIFSGINLPSWTNPLKWSIVQLENERRNCDHQFSIRWFEWDMPYLCEEKCSPAMSAFSYSQSLFKRMVQTPCSLTELKYKAAGATGLLFDFITASHKTFLENPSTAPWMGNPKGFILS